MIGLLSFHIIHFVAIFCALGKITRSMAYYLSGWELVSAFFVYWGKSSVGDVIGPYWRHCLSHRTLVATCCHLQLCCLPPANPVTAKVGSLLWSSKFSKTCVRNGSLCKEWWYDCSVNKETGQEKQKCQWHEILCKKLYLKPSLHIVRYV